MELVTPELSNDILVLKRVKSKVLDREELSLKSRPIIAPNTRLSTPTNYGSMNVGSPRRPSFAEFLASPAYNGSFTASFLDTAPSPVAAPTVHDHSNDILLSLEAADGEYLFFYYESVDEPEETSTTAVYAPPALRGLWKNLKTIGFSKSTVRNIYKHTDEDKRNGPIQMNNSVGVIKDGFWPKRLF